MSKEKRAVVNSDLTSKRSLALPSAVAERRNQKMIDEIGEVRHTDTSYRNRGGNHSVNPKGVKASSRRTQLLALSKFVNKAFTGWTIKTQS